MNCTMQASLELLDEKLNELEKNVKGLRSDVDEAKKLSNEIRKVMDSAFERIREATK